MRPRKEEQVKCPHCQREYDELLIVTDKHGLCTFEGCHGCKQGFEQRPSVYCGICRQPYDELVMGFNPRTGQREPLCQICIQTATAPDLERLLTPAA